MKGLSARIKSTPTLLVIASFLAAARVCYLPQLVNPPKADPRGLALLAG